MKKGILLINVGTPDSPTVKDVRAYLKEFLNDPFVIEMPAILRKILVNGIIVPFRAPQSAKRYEQLWTKEGSPLLVHLLNLERKLQKRVANIYQVFTAMSYGQPQLSKTLEAIEKAEINELIVLPLYPHFAKSTTLSAKHAINALTTEWRKTKVRYINHFYQNTGFISAVAEQAKNFNLSDYDHILFSYHSLPLKQVKASCESADKTQCYDTACYETSELIAEHLKLKKGFFSTAFQSRFSKNWLAPYTSDILRKLAQQGKKKVLVFTPSFVADCLETTVEIGIEYRDFFIKNGGEELDLVPCVNTSDEWIEGIVKIIDEEL